MRSYLRVARKKLGLSQYQFSDRLEEFSREQIAFRELKPTYVLKLEDLVYICEEFGLDPIEFYEAAKKEVEMRDKTKGGE